MTLPVLHDDALHRDRDASALALCLPWIRSLPLSSLLDLRIRIDGVPADPRQVTANGVHHRVDRLPHSDDWWYLQDRLVATLPPVTPGTHDVDVSLRLLIPYLAGSAGGPLILPFSARRTLEAR